MTTMGCTLLPEACGTAKDGRSDETLLSLLQCPLYKITSSQVQKFPQLHKALIKIKEATEQQNQ